MITVVHHIQEAVEEYSTTTSAQHEQVLVKHCNNLLMDLGHAQRQYQTMELIQLSINQCYILLVSTVDQAYRNAIPPHLLDCLHHTIQRFVAIYASYIHPKQKISLPEQQYLQQTLQTQFDEISPLLATKNIPLTYIKEVQHALDTVFQSGKLPDLCFYHRTYLPSFMQALRYIADEGREKDWKTRFLLLMIRYNFNYPGFFNRWREQLTNAIQKFDNLKESLQYLDELSDLLRLSWYEGDCYFDLSRRPLLEDMREHIDETIQKVHTADLENILETDLSLLTTLNGNELNLAFHYTYHHKIYDYPTKRDAAKAFSKFILSKTGRKISYKTLEKFDKGSLESSAHKISRLFKNISEDVRKDFPS